MALKDMLEHIKAETMKEVDDHKNQVKIETAKVLIAYGEALEQQQEEQLYFLSEQLKKKETMLKSEQDFIFSTQDLKAEDQFIEELLLILDQELLKYIEDEDRYESMLTSWFEKVCEALCSVKLTISVREQDLKIINKIIKSLSMNASVEVDPNIQVGFFVAGEEDVFVDLTYKTLFKERKQELLNIVMNILKEES